jgi:hypothetical protein
MLLIGRRAICNYLGVTWRTVLRRKLYGLMIRRHPPNKPCLFTEEHEAWVLRYNEILSKKG